MIAGHGQGRGQVFKNMGAVMAYIAQLAMHDIGCPNNFASKGLPDALVARHTPKIGKSAGASRIDRGKYPRGRGRKGRAR